MPLIDKLDHKIGRFAIPGLIQLIAILQLVTLGLFTLISPEAKTPFEQFLLLKPDNVLHGEVWRLFTYVFIPRGNLIIAIIGAMFLMWLGRGLDEAWGAFRVNLYVLSGMFFLAIGSLLFGYEADQLWLYLTTLFAFAAIYPNEEIMLYFVLPLKMKWIAALSAGFLAVTLLRSPVIIIPAIFALLNFFIAFGPGFLKGRLAAAKVTQRRERFEDAALDPSASFHRCSVCGKTEQDDRTLDFRVTDNGDEICSECRKARVEAG
jgi:hypothetical protein